MLPVKKSGDNFSGKVMAPDRLLHNYLNQNINYLNLFGWFF